MDKLICKLKQLHIWTGVASFFLLIFGISGTMFASLGLCLFCIIPVFTFVLSIFGLSIGIIADYNYWLIGFGLLSLGLAVFLYIKRKKYCKTC